MRLGESINTQKEYSLKLKPLDVLYIEYPHVVIVTYHLPTLAGGHRNIPIGECLLKFLSDGLHAFFILHEDSDGRQVPNRSFNLDDSLRQPIDDFVSLFHSFCQYRSHSFVVDMLWQFNGAVDTSCSTNNRIRQLV